MPTKVRDGSMPTSSLSLQHMFYLLGGPTATTILSRFIVALHSVALCFPRFGGVSQDNRATPPEKSPVAPTFQLLKGVLHFKLPLGRRRGTGGVAATLPSVVLHGAT